MWREILGLEKKPASLVDTIVPQRSFADVILPDETRQQLYEALTQIEKHRLIFTQWGLGERHPTGIGLVFNFAGPPGTGKTICAEAIAFTLGRKLMRIKYSELESVWAGETGKNVRTVFREARAAEAVLFFDEADSIAARRFTNIQAGYEREANQTVNILLKEVEEHEGVVIFATNLASNFDPAFERRIRTHVLFLLPNVAQRQAIWKVQVHPQKTPLAEDVDFRALAERFEIAGGDIRNAVLKAAQMAAAEEGADEQKRIHQRHFVAATESVLRAKGVMQQNAVDSGSALPAWQEALEATHEAIEERFRVLESDHHASRTELELLGESQEALRLAAEESQVQLSAALDEQRESLAQVRDKATGLATDLATLRDQLQSSEERHSRALVERTGEQERALAAITEKVVAQQSRLERATLLPVPPAITGVIALLLMVLGFIGGHFLWPR